MFKATQYLSLVSRDTVIKSNILYLTVVNTVDSKGNEQCTDWWHTLSQADICVVGFECNFITTENLKHCMHILLIC